MEGGNPEKLKEWGGRMVQGQELLKKGAGTFPI